MQEGVDSEETVNDDGNEECVERNLDERPEDVFEGDFGFEVDSDCHSSHKKERHLEVPVNLFFCEIYFGQVGQ